MFSKVLSAAVYGVQSRMVQVEADITDGLPSFAMVGYLSTQVKEAQERVRAALNNSGIRLQPKKITVNLSPADLHKSGTGFDLPIAVAIMASYGMIAGEALEHTLIIGELSLSGNIHPVHGVLPVAANAKNCQCTKCIVPWENRREAQAVQGLEVIGVQNLKQVAAYLQNGRKPDIIQEERKAIPRDENRLDFADVRGQKAAKRAALIAAAGFHNLMMVGAPGSGKSMIAKRIPTILPDMTEKESIDLSGVYSVLGKLMEDGKLMSERPFRSPHHTITAKALCGGGRVPIPGEISMAHCGVLFLDELAEFRRETLEVLRQPLENGMIHITRCGYQYDFPADFMLVAAMNPCPCGYYPDLSRCQCTYTEIRKYMGKISMPFLDRIDMSVEVSRIEYQDILQQTPEETSCSMKEKVEMAWIRQKERMGIEEAFFNSRMGNQEIEKYCKLGSMEKRFMQRVYDEMHLTARGYGKILKVARTIADLEETENIKEEHLKEALCYRSHHQFYR